MKCRYKNCPFKDCEIPEGEWVLVGKSTYYHKECFEEKEAIREIIDVFYRECNPNVVFTNLQNVIRKIVIGRKFPAKKLLYGLKYCIKHGWNLRYPPGLFSVVENMEWQEEYDKHNKPPRVKLKETEITDDFDFGDTEKVYSVPEQKTFDDIFQG